MGPQSGSQENQEEQQAEQLLNQTQAAAQLNSSQVIRLSSSWKAGGSSCRPAGPLDTQKLQLDLTLVHALPLRHAVAVTVCCRWSS